jgi:NADH:ubiquinone oxidoreductase subunit H
MTAQPIFAFFDNPYESICYALFWFADQKNETAILYFCVVLFLSGHNNAHTAYYTVLINYVVSLKATLHSQMKHSHEGKDTKVN